MTFHVSMLPFFLISAVWGAIQIGVIFRTKQANIILGTLIGASVGVIGSMLFMFPLNSCTFEPDRETLEFVIGVVLFFTGSFIFIYGTAWSCRYLLSGVVERRIMIGSADETTNGMFNSHPIVPFLLLLPTLVILVVFIYLPAIQTFTLSTKLVRLGAPRAPFRCVDNFTGLMEPELSFWTIVVVIIAIILTGLAFYLQRTTSDRKIKLADKRKNPLYDPEMLERIRAWAGITVMVAVYLLLMDLWEEDYGLVFFNTIFISGMIVIVGLALSLAIAFLAFQPVKGATIYRTLLIWPYAISPTIAGILFEAMFNPTTGMFDYVLGELVGGGLPNYLQNAWMARWVIIIASVWKTLGYNILFYLAGLQNVPLELIEAAAIDGANAWQRFRYVILPALSPITFFLIITNLTSAFFSIFGTIDFLTKGAPANATSVQIYEIYTTGIASGRLGQAAAQSIILFLGVIVVTVWQFRTSGRQVNYGS